MSFQVEFDIPVQNANGSASETVGFGETSVSRSLKVGPLTGIVQDGDVSHKVTFTYERTESNADLDEPPAMVPYKAYRLTIEEVQP